MLCRHENIKWQLWKVRVRLLYDPQLIATFRAQTSLYVQLRMLMRTKMKSASSTWHQCRK